MDGLNTVLEYLTSVPAWYLATSVDGAATCTSIFVLLRFRTASCGL